MNKRNHVGEVTEGVETTLTHAGREPANQYGFVNTPIVRGSTVVFPTLSALEGGKQDYVYGRRGNPTSESVQALVTELEAAHGTLLAPSGLSAITIAILSTVKAGDEILVTDSVYGPTRTFCDGVLHRMRVTTRYYDPRIGPSITNRITERTRAIFVESPGSLTFEVQDLPAIAAARGERDIKIIVDNSWATPLFHRPLALGADLVVHAGTKMFVGHSDAMFGTISANEGAWKPLLDTHGQLGICVAPEDAFLAARGIRTLAIRMKEHHTRALELAAWLERQPGVERVLHPGLASHPDHDLFRRDFAGGGSLFAIELSPRPHAALAAFMDGMRLFSMGYSWGGYESLILPTRPASIRTATSWDATGPLVRIHVGFEDADDLRRDLTEGLQRYLA